MARKHFHQFLGDVRAGALNEELTEKLTTLVMAVQETSRVGTLTLRLKIVPTKGLAMEIEDEVTVKAPSLPKPSTLLFPTVEGNLQVQNPMQKSLDLTVVNDGGVKQLNTVGHTPAGGTPLAEVPASITPASALATVG